MKKKIENSLSRGGKFLMSFITDWIKSNMPTGMDVARDEHVAHTSANCEKIKANANASTRTAGYWWSTNMTNIYHTQESALGRDDNGHCLIGALPNGKALSANSYDTALYVLESQIEEKE